MQPSLTVSQVQLSSGGPATSATKSMDQSSAIFTMHPILWSTVAQCIQHIITPMQWPDLDSEI